MIHERFSLPSFCVLAALAFPLGALAQEIRLGNEFQVNTYTTDSQQGPSVAVDADGGFVVAWRVGSETVYPVLARRFSSAGTPLAGEFQLNSYTFSFWDFALAADSDGDFVVAWTTTYRDGDSTGIFARRFSSAGSPLASDFQVNAFTNNEQNLPSVASEADGDFVVVWQSERAGFTNYGLFARRFSSAGAPLTNEFQVNTLTIYPTDFGHLRPTVAADADGDFVVAWQSYNDGGAGSDFGIFARRFSSGGAPLTSVFLVNTYTNDRQVRPEVAASASGDFVVAWQSSAQDDGSSYGVFARRFSSAGSPLASELQVNTYTTGFQGRPSVTTDADGDFVVAWTSGHDGAIFALSGAGIFARRFSSAGTPLAVEFQVNTYTFSHQYLPSVAASASGDFVVAWQSYGQVGASWSIFAQRFAAPKALDIDGNGATQPLTDGILVVRRFFGFSGATLTNSVVGAGCTRCDAAAIEPYIAGLGLLLDIDGNLAIGPLSDGLLAVRYLFGFRGDTLTNGAIGGACARCTAAVIEPYLAGLTD